MSKTWNEKVADQQKLDAQEYFEQNLPFYVRKDFKSCYAHKFYQWQTDFLINKKLLALLTAANQIGKSSIQIIRCLNQGYRTDLWSYWFPRRRPTTFLYLYPESKLATAEFAEKWVKEYLPRGPMIKDPRWGWKANYDGKGNIESLVLATGVTIYFRFYSQAPKTMQAITADAVFFDEEPPKEHYDEIMVRTQARQAQGTGFISMVFTATLGQQYLYDAMERQGQPEETFKNAWKRQVSVYDCLIYADGSPSPIWTVDYIEQELIPKYRDPREIQKRIFGKFVKDVGLVFYEFQNERNTEPVGATDITDWNLYLGMDFGCGGEHGHSSSIAIVAVDPTMSEARQISSWHSKKKRMTQGDLLEEFKGIISDGKAYYSSADWMATDLFELAIREGLTINKAEKSHEIGINMLNTLFKAGRFKIWLGEGSGHNDQTVMEFGTVSDGTAKKSRVDDATDATRYAIAATPMRLTGLEAPNKMTKQEEKLHPRMAFYKGVDRKDDPMMFHDDFQDDIDETIQSFEDIL